MALPPTLTPAQRAWLERTPLDCCDRPLDNDEAAEFLRKPDPFDRTGERQIVAYVHPGHQPMSYRSWGDWVEDPYPGAEFRDIVPREAKPA